ncbi:MAG: Rpn family recombination-promoting nuclease/putative transposase [Myxococcota bacterium]
MTKKSPRHDGFVRRLFAHHDVTVAQLRWLVSPALAAELDWATLRQGPTDTADVTGRARRSDVIFEIRTRRGDPLLLHILLEHQRAPDPLMAFRMVQYQTRIWQAFIDHVGKDTLTALPPILPIVLYNGTQAWRAPAAIEDLARAPASWALGAHQLSGRFVLLDLSQVPDDAIETQAANAHLELGLLALKHISDPDPWTRFLEWEASLRKVRAMAQGNDRIQAVLHYLFRAAAPPSAEERRRVIQLLPEFESDIVTWEQQIRQEALSEGERKGRSEGRLEGRLEALRHTVRVLLKARFGALTSEAKRQIDEADEDTLNDFVERFPSFEGSLDEFLA